MHETLLRDFLTCSGQEAASIAGGVSLSGEDAAEEGNEARARPAG